MKGVFTVLVLAAALIAPAASIADSPPAGATAQCKDGTYSFSQTHSGTCSSHGGVAVWLDGSGATATPTPTTTTTPAPTTTTTPATTTAPTTTTTTTPTPGPSGGSSSGTVSGGNGTTPFLPISGQLSGFAGLGTDRTFTAYTLCFPSYGATVSSGTLDWGDSATADVGARATGLAHQYTYGGSYTLTLTCRDSASFAWTATTTATINGPTRPVPPSPPTTSPKPAPLPSTGGASRVTLGTTVLLHPRAKTRSCTLGPNPDPRCSPGAYYSGLTKAVVCSATFRTSSVRNVPESLKHAVEIEYGLAPRAYGSSLEIDHIVSLELGGSNDIANLYPEKAPGFRLKDKLENALHDSVCSGKISLRAAQTGIASNWQAIYKRVFGSIPT